MKKPCFLALAACASLFVFVPSAGATSVDVRVEGATQTLFEGPVETTPHLLRASSDTTDRTCDGTNNDAFPTPGPTAIGALDDAATAAGFDWDAHWSDQYNEYFVSRVGPDVEDNDNFYYWGAYLNGDLTSVGGCEVVVDDGDEVLWAYDAFSKTKALRLTGPATTSVGDPVQVNVTDTVSDTPVQGASVGDQTTDADGNATVTFDQAGLVDLKASEPSAIRSNGLALCVQTSPADDCSDPQIPTITGNASAGVTVGGQVDDSAHLDGGFRPTGAITFRLYGPNDADCSNAPVETSTKAVTGNGGYDSSAFTTAQAGTYHWIASYSGDGNNNAVAGTCGDADQTVVVSAVPDSGPTTVGESVAAPVTAAVTPSKAKAKVKACAGRSGKSLKRCKALNRCKKLKGKKKRAKCRARARKIGK